MSPRKVTRPRGVAAPRRAASRPTRRRQRPTRSGPLRRPNSPGVPEAARWLALAALLAIVLVAGLAIFAPTQDPPAGPSIAAQILYAAPTASDQRIVLPPEVTQALLDVGLGHGTIRVVRVDGDGRPESKDVDLTPRVGDSADSPPLKVKARAEAAVRRNLVRVVADLNRPATTSRHALYLGLLTANVVPGAPAYVIGDGLDTTDPLDFDDLAWEVPPTTIVARLRATHELPRLTDVGVTFVVTGVAGQQPPLRVPQRAYREDIWRAVLLAGEAASVSFVEAPASIAAAAGTGPAVPLPIPPRTPVPTHADATTTRCTLTTSTYFLPDSATFRDRTAVKAALATCARAIRARPGAQVSLDGWVASFGPRGADGRPRTNPPADIRLSRQRVYAVAGLLVELGIPRQRIGHAVGHGNQGQPVPTKPSSAANRVVRITVTDRS